MGLLLVLHRQRNTSSLFIAVESPETGSETYIILSANVHFILSVFYQHAWSIHFVLCFVSEQVYKNAYCYRLFSLNFMRDEISNRETLIKMQLRNLFYFSTCSSHTKVFQFVITASRFVSCLVLACVFVCVCHWDGAPCRLSPGLWSFGWK